MKCILEREEDQIKYNAFIANIIDEFKKDINDDEELLDAFKNNLYENYADLIAYMIKSEDDEGLNEISLIFKFYTSLDYENKCSEFKSDNSSQALKMLTSRIDYLYEYYASETDINSLCTLESLNKMREDNEKYFNNLKNKDDANFERYNSNLARLDELIKVISAKKM